MPETIERAEHAPSTEEERLEAEIEELKQPFVPKTFPSDRMEMTLEKDPLGQPVERNGFIATVTVEFDPRSERHVLEYVFDEEGADTRNRIYPFTDDFKRAINRQLTNEKGKPAGRDDRFIVRPRAEEAERERLRLQEQLTKSSELLDRLLTENELPTDAEQPIESIVKQYRTGTFETERENEFGDARRERQPAFTIEWLVAQNGVMLEWKGIPKALGSARNVSEDQARHMIEQPQPPDVVQQSLEEYRRHVKEKFATLPIATLRENIAAIQIELSKYSLRGTDAPVAQVHVIVTGPVRKTDSARQSTESAPSSQQSHGPTPTTTPEAPEPTKHTNMADLLGKFGKSAQKQRRKERQ